MEHQVFQAIHNKSNKAKCGDSIEVYENERFLIAALADGVSSAPFDWLGSHIACSESVARLKKLQDSVETEMIKAADKADNNIKGNPTRKGMLTSLSLIVWEKNTDYVYILNVGDSRVYIGYENSLQQVTKDDTTVEVFMQNGKPVYQHGVPLFKRFVTRSLGQNEPLQLKVEKFQFLPNQILILISDGIFKDGNYLTDIEKMLKKSNLETSIDTFVKESTFKSKDDASMIIVRRFDYETDFSNIYRKCLEESIGCNDFNLPTSIFLKYLQSDLINSLTENDNERVNKILDYAEQTQVLPDFKFLSRFLSLAIKQGFDRKLVSRLRDIIRVTTL